MQIIKTALLSYGMSGKVFHAPFLNAHPGFVLVGAWERSVQKIQIDYPSCTSFESLESLLNDASIDLVIVNTPVATHYEFAKKVLLAGKHALVEKSFTSTVAQAEELDAIAKARNLKLFVFHNRRYNSDFRVVKQVIDENLLGDLVEVEFRFDRFNPVLSPKKHKEENTAGAGILRDLGSHLIDQSLFLFGMPSAVFADIQKTRDHTLVDDCIDILLYYPRLRVRLKAGFFVREPNPAYVVHGKKGSFLKHRGDVQEQDLIDGKKPNSNSWGLELIENEGLLHTESNGLIVRKKIPTPAGNYNDFFEAMYQCIANNAEAPVTAQEGIQVMKIIAAAEFSSTEKKVISVAI